MPVVPAEIMLSKILANGFVILAAAELSLLLVVRWWLHVPIAGSTLLFLAGSCFYVFTVAALGILLGTVAATMGSSGCWRSRDIGHDAAFGGHHAHGKHAGLAAIPNADHQPDAALRRFRPGCALSRRRPLNRMA